MLNFKNNFSELTLIWDRFWEEIGNISGMGSLENGQLRVEHLTRFAGPSKNRTSP